MNQSTTQRINSLLDRLVRVTASQNWSDSLNPAQRAVLIYLSTANAFSRAPSIIAEYMCTTRGTTSQTLKALERKGLVSRTESPTDKRSITYNVSDLGLSAIRDMEDFDDILENISPQESSNLLLSLESILQQLLAVREYKPFGICNNCKYHEKTSSGQNCSLLKIELSNKQATQLCHEQIPAKAVD